MDDLAARVADAISDLRLDIEHWEAALIAKAIIPLVYEDAARIAEHGFGEDPVAEAIRSHSMAVVGE